MSEKRKINTTIEGKPGFRPIEETQDLLKYLNYAADTNAKVDFRIGSTVVKIPARVDDKTSLKNGVILNLDKPLTDEQGEGFAQASEFMAVMYLQGQMLLGVRCKKATVTGKQVFLVEEPRYFVMQRRSEARFEIPRGYDFEITLDAIEGPRRKVTKRLLDISTDGLAFQSPSPREAMLYSVGTTLNNAMVPLQGRMIDVDLVVKSHAPLNHDPKLAGVKVGCKITAISPEDEEYLLGFVASKLLGL